MLILLFAVVLLLFAVVVSCSPWWSPVRRGGSPVRHGASRVRRGGGDDDRSPSPSTTLCKSRGRMQTPSAAAKSDSPPRGRTMTRSASRAALRGGSPKAADNVKIVAASAAAHYQPLDAKHPDSVRAQSVSRGYSDSSPDFSSSRLVRASARVKSVERNNGSGDVGNRRRSERISSRAPSTKPNARGVQVKPRGRSAARSVESSGCATPQTPTDWNSPTSPRNTDEVPSQARSHLQRNSELFTRGE